jgi:glucose uptake protein
MILPSSYAITFAILVLGMLCWGSWASLYKATGNLRYELFYFDFSLGMVLAAVLAALTLGTFGFDGFSFTDDLLHASKKNDLMGALGGAVFNLGNILLLAGVSEAGMSVAFPIGIGSAIIVGAIWNLILKPHENLALLLLGSAVIVAGIIVCTIAYRLYEFSKIDELVRTGKQKSTRRKVRAKGAAIAALAGVVLGSYFPIIAHSMSGEAGLGPYAVSVMFAVGVFFSTFVYNLFLMNLPVSGKPLEILDYIKVSARDHRLGVLSGVIWMTGMVASLVSAAAEGTSAVNSSISYGLLQGGVVIAAIWGLMVWKEYDQADGRVRSLLFIMLILFVFGIGLVSLAPALGPS